MRLRHYSSRPAILLPPTVFAIDRALRSYRPSLVTAGLLDEVAHVATAITLLAPFRPPIDRARVIGALAGAVLLDADHVPGELGAHWLTRGTYRPYPHALVSVLVLIGLGLCCGGRWRRGMLSAAAGVATHLVRDLATDGVSLFWPLTPRNVRIAYWVYATILILAALAAPPARCGRAGRR